MKWYWWLILGLVAAAGLIFLVANLFVQSDEKNEQLSKAREAKLNKAMLKSESEKEEIVADVVAP